MIGLYARARSLWRALRHRSGFEAAMDEEFRLHIELRTEDLIRAGLPPKEAARRARLEFGGVENYKEQARQSRGLRMVDELRGDARYGLRTLLRSPGFAVVTILTLALGIGANTAIFSALDAVLLRPLPFEDPGRLVQLEEVNIPFRVDETGHPKLAPDITDVRELTDVFTSVAAMAPGGLNLSGAGAPRRIDVGVVTPDFFTTLGIYPVLGRAFAAEEGLSGGPRVAIVSNAFWRVHLGSDPSTADREITLSGKPYDVVGVMPRGFAFPERAEVWIPMSVPLTWEDWEPFRQYMPSRVIARLAPGVTLQRADGRVRALVDAFERPAGAVEVSTADLVRPLRAALVGERRTALLVLIGATTLVLLVACANVANLLLSRATVRRREVALRVALGATPGRVMRLLMVESVLLALVSGAVGVALAFASVHLLDVLVPVALAGAAPLRIDSRVLAFALTVALATGVVFGLVPALTSLRADAGEMLKSGGQSTGYGGDSDRLRRAFVVGEIAVAVMLLIGSALMLRSLHAILSSDPGVQPEGVATLELTLANADFPTRTARLEFYQGVLERLDSDPRVGAAAFINELPLRGAGGVSLTVYPEGRRPETMDVKYMAQDLRVTPDYFRALGIDVLAGRSPRPVADTSATGEVAINLEMARLFWPGRNPLGERLEMPGFSGRNWVVVGLVANVRPRDLEAEIIPQVYYSLLDTPYDNAALVGRGRVPAETLSRALQDAVRAVAPAQAVYNVRTMEDVIARAIAPRRTNTVLVASFGLLALLLAGIGVYGVMAFGVARRTREIGIRMALGAEPWRVLRGVVGEGLLLAMIGTAAGLAGAWMLSRVLSGLVYGVTTRDPLAFTIAPLALLAAALLASLLPARRATRVDPVEAIRVE
jgi:putative ABC transport system permease protein